MIQLSIKPTCKSTLRALASRCEIYGATVATNHLLAESISPALASASSQLPPTIYHHLSSAFLRDSRFNSAKGKPTPSIPEIAQSRSSTLFLSLRWTTDMNWLLTWESHLYRIKLTTHKLLLYRFRHLPSCLLPTSQNRLHKSSVILNHRHSRRKKLFYTVVVLKSSGQSLGTTQGQGYCDGMVNWLQRLKFRIFTVIQLYHSQLSQTEDLNIRLCSQMQMEVNGFGKCSRNHLALLHESGASSFSQSFETELAKINKGLLSKAMCMHHGA